jgi:hypothetical protein
MKQHGDCMFWEWDRSTWSWVVAALVYVLGMGQSTWSLWTKKKVVAMSITSVWYFCNGISVMVFV